MRNFSTIVDIYRQRKGDAIVQQWTSRGGRKEFNEVTAVKSTLFAT